MKVANFDCLSKHTPMHIDPMTHLIAGVNFILSPNHDHRPEQTAIDLIVIHNISLPPGVFGQDYIHALFQNKLDTSKHPYFDEIKDLKVSSHLLIERSGQLTQFVPFNMRAWHAGQSKYQGRVACNDFSIGIELEGTDTQAYTDNQYSVLNAVITNLKMAYPHLSKNNIAGHSDIAPGRKTDPGPAFDWSRLHSS